MIDYIGGILEAKYLDNIIVEANAIGYKIAVPSNVVSKLPPNGSFVKIYIVEAVSGMYGGVINLYGFLSKEERDMYLLIKDEVPGTGAKKALEYLDKVSKSFADFKTAVSSKNSAMLTSIFGFTKKTSDKLIAALKDKISSVSVIGEEKWGGAQSAPSGAAAEAVAALIALGCKEIQARNAVNEIFNEDAQTAVEELIKKALAIYKE